MKKYIAYAVLSFSISLISSIVYPLCAQTTDSLKNPQLEFQLRAELVQIQALSASIKAKADSIESLVKQRTEIIEMSKAYWAELFQPCKEDCGDKFAELIADLVQDKLIKNEPALRSYHLSFEIFRINGQKQSPEVTKRYQEKYLSTKPNGKYPTSMTHTVGGFLGIRR